MNQRQQLRKKMRNARRALSPLQQKIASKNLAKTLRSQPCFLRAKTVALYLAADGEIDPTQIAKLCRKLGKKLYLPVLHPVKHNSLWFTHYHPNSQMIKNCYGISEPDPRKNRIKPAWALDLVLLPLVAFDSHGGRMGMGGGYYDRSFAFTRKRQGKLSPKLIGLAHELQKVDLLPIASWDIPLSAIATDRHFYPAAK